MVRKDLELARDTALDAMEYGLAEEYQAKIDKMEESTMQLNLSYKLPANWTDLTHQIYSCEHIKEVEKAHER